MTRRKNKLEVKFCDVNCKFAKFSKYVPGCHTYNPIDCKKKGHEVPQGLPCTDYIRRKK